MSKWPVVKLDKHIIESKEQYGSEKLNGIQVLSVTNDQGFVFSDKRTSENVSNYKIIKNGYFAYNPYRINVGSLAFAGDEYSGIVSPAYVVFSCAKDLDSEYLWKYLKSDVGLFHIRQGGKGSVRSSLSFERLQEIEIPLPPLPEQKRIVKKIKEIENIVNEANEIKKGEYKYADFLIEEVFSKSISKKWEKKKLGDPEIAKISSGGTPSRGNLKYYNGDIVWLKSGELRDNLNITNSEEKITKNAVENSSVKIFDAGTVLLAMYGATVGKVGMLGVSAATNQAVAAIKPNQKKLFNKYLFYFLKSLRKDLVGIGFGGAQPNISQTVVKKILIPLPDVEEQKKIVARFEAILAKVDLLNQEIKKSDEYLKTLMSSVLSKAFNGEL